VVVDVVVDMVVDMVVHTMVGTDGEMRCPIDRREQ